MARWWLVSASPDEQWSLVRSAGLESTDAVSREREKTHPVTLDLWEVQNQVKLRNSWFKVTEKT